MSSPFGSMTSNYFGNDGSEALPARVVTMEANFDELIVLVFVIVNVTVLVPVEEDILVRC